MKITIDVKEPYDKGVMQISIARGNEKGGVHVISTGLDLTKHDDTVLSASDNGFTIENSISGISISEAHEDDVPEILKRIVGAIDEYFEEGNE